MDFVGSDEGGRHAAAFYTLIQTAKLNGIDPQAWLADVLSRINDYPASRLAELLPWKWKAQITVTLHLTKSKSAASLLKRRTASLRSQRWYE